jgi:hypothetical protein
MPGQIALSCRTVVAQLALASVPADIMPDGPGCPIRPGASSQRAKAGGKQHPDIRGIYAL